MSRQQGPLADPTYIGKLRHREKEIERQRSKDVADVMSSPSGRRFMYALLFDRGNLLSTYGGNDVGIHRHEGRRSLAVELGAELQSDHAEMWVLMIKEHLAEQSNDATLRAAALTAVSSEELDA